MTQGVLDPRRETEAQRNTVTHLGRFSRADVGPCTVVPAQSGRGRGLESWTQQVCWRPESSNSEEMWVGRSPLVAYLASGSGQ